LEERWRNSGETEEKLWRNGFMLSPYSGGTEIGVRISSKNTSLFIFSALLGTFWAEYSPV
jgi:hypothetical protein